MSVLFYTYKANKKIEKNKRYFVMANLPFGGVGGEGGRKSLSRFTSPGPLGPSLVTWGAKNKPACERIKLRKELLSWPLLPTIISLIPLLPGVAQPIRSGSRSSDEKNKKDAMRNLKSLGTVRGIQNSVLKTF